MLAKWVFPDAQVLLSDIDSDAVDLAHVKMRRFMRLTLLLEQICSLGVLTILLT